MGWCPRPAVCLDRRSDQFNIHCRVASTIGGLPYRTPSLKYYFQVTANSGQTPIESLGPGNQLGTKSACHLVYHRLISLGLSAFVILVRSTDVQESAGQCRKRLQCQMPISGPAANQRMLGKPGHLGRLGLEVLADNSASCSSARCSARLCCWVSSERSSAACQHWHSAQVPGPSAEKKEIPAR